MKLEIDIDEDYYKIICKRVKENKPYHSSYEYEVIADGKPIEQETVSKESYDHEYFLRKEFEIKIAKLQRQLEEQEPKIGHWTYICNSSVNGLKIVECSECGTRTYGSGSFCPYCGAKMVEPQESEDI